MTIINKLVASTPPKEYPSHSPRATSSIVDSTKNSKMEFVGVGLSEFGKVRFVTSLATNISSLKSGTVSHLPV